MHALRLMHALRKDSLARFARSPGSLRSLFFFKHSWRVLACVEVDACVEEGQTRSLRSLAWLASLALFC